MKLLPTAVAIQKKLPQNYSYTICLFADNPFVQTNGNALLEILANVNEFHFWGYVRHCLFVSIYFSLSFQVVKRINNIQKYIGHLFFLCFIFSENVFHSEIRNVVFKQNT